MSIPPWERASETAVRLPLRLRVKVTPRAVCLAVEGLYGVTHLRKGSMASNALKADDGMDRGMADKKGRRTEGLEVWRDLDRSHS